MISEKNSLSASSAPYRSGVVTILGAPNVGKSTLLNQLLQQKIAIVTPKAQTTRNRIMGIVTGPDFQILLLDTPGLHAAKEEINRRMVKIALASLADADAVLFLVDCSVWNHDKRISKAEEYAGYLKKITKPVVLALNKQDLIPQQQLLPIMDWCRTLHPFASVVPVSALSGQGVDVLLAELVTLLPEGPQYYPEDLPTDATERFIAAEIIREKIFLLIRKEVPYSTAVVIDSFEEGDPAVIRATIMVERDSQKGILVGQKGKMLATIRQSAAADIAQVLDRRVRLHLWIKVSKDWTENTAILRDLGLV
ncbi:GTPase Era [Desulfobulbus oligotrophicus]|uniref:GTPase Era n=1 Tax=Desulfobulbus oligotrophicus TaxID=1909699 RepID=A0A7T5VF76_9BACT|nr:GTPase Era [Desulfobulbus oligotrophicus]QQG66684.1 GTPase Era [Desulfobulbus oligotrophicus]